MSGMSVNTYSPKDVKVDIGGYTLVGWEDISISRSASGFIPVRGIRGKHTRVPSMDTSASIIVTLHQTSPSNDILNAIHSEDLEKGTGRIVLTLRDYSGRTVVSSDEAYVVAYPEVVYSRDFEFRAWTIFCQSTSEYTIGGNTKPETPLVDSIVRGIKGVAGNIF